MGKPKDYDDPDNENYDGEHDEDHDEEEDDE
jgi:hypothetical protein